MPPAKVPVMQPSVTLCRAQEAHHEAIARNATLDNVRLVAQSAAAAWAKEGLAAHAREERQQRVVAFRELNRTSRNPANDWNSLSENPDRGYADAG